VARPVMLLYPFDALRKLREGVAPFSKRLVLIFFSWEERDVEAFRRALLRLWDQTFGRYPYAVIDIDGVVKELREGYEERDSARVASAVAWFFLTNCALFSGITLREFVFGSERKLYVLAATSIENKAALTPSTVRRIILEYLRMNEGKGARGG